jgi:hypothetical protein
MRSIINKISQALQVVLLAPIKLPGKALNILKYIAVGLGVIESVLDNGKQEEEIRDQKNIDQGLKMNADRAGEDDEGGER